MSLDGITRVLAIKGFSAATMEVGTKRVDIWLERDGSGFRCARCGQVHLVAHDEHEVTVQDLPMVERHEEGILRYFVKRVTGGISEGMNNKIKVVKRRAYGYRDPAYFILKIHQACGRI